MNWGIEERRGYGNCLIGKRPHYILAMKLDTIAIELWGWSL
ncbi:MAG: hypothetical protein PHD95_05930 [Candidatus ainarchaeum sp.]|nr:hypothetical protein [Candidatus ainarchaeum sp.]